ncbi:unnamed protein product [Lathyrus sativus]|nr:unnamed protein product [Lathyrus sativus]
MARVKGAPCVDRSPVSGPNPPASPEIRYRGVQKWQCGQYAAEIRDPLKDDTVFVNYPTSSGMSSTVELFSGPRVGSSSTSRVSTSRVHMFIPVGCHSDCDSSSSVVDDDEDCVVVCSSVRKPQPRNIDLNLPAPMNYNDEEICAIDLNL